MAELRVEGDELVLHLGALEKTEGFHGAIRLPLSAGTTVTAVTAVGAVARAAGAST